MIIQEDVETYIRPITKLHYEELGYTGSVGNQHTKSKKIRVLVSHLPPNSNMKIKCQCDDCGHIWSQPYQVANKKKDKHFCRDCTRKEIGRTMDRTNIDAATRNRTGSNHPRWNPDKTAFQEYSRRVRWLSEKVYVNNKHLLNPDDLPRTLCGIDEGYQLDHKMSIKKAFDLGIPEHKAASINNLQLLSWTENRSKSHK
tara:strand:+ start:327 stop:923 length:597 start_codon:yes stop_codon:yes gene_type:complete